MRTPIAICALALLPSVSHASCATNAERDALAVRALQSQMMVAALSCNQQGEYNQILRKHSSHFSHSGKVLKAYFKRAYGSGHESKLNRFVTRLANEATQDSMKHDPDGYCQKTQHMFRTLKRASAKELGAHKSDFQQASLRNVKSCARFAKQ